MEPTPPVETATTVTGATSTRLYRNRDFLLLWSGQAVSTLGTSVSALALPLLALALTNSPVQAGLIAALQLVPYLALSLPAGALVDRWDRKVVMIWCDTVRFVTFGSVPLAFVIGRLSVAELYVVAGVAGVCFVFFDVAQISALPRVVAQEHLTQANALNDVAISIATFLGPALSGIMISLGRTIAAGAVVAYAFDSLSFLVSVLSLSWMRVPFQGARSASALTSLWSDISQGLRFVWTHRRIRILALLILGIGVLSSFTYLATIVLVRDLVHGDTRVYGLVFSVGSGAGILGAILAPRIQRRLRYGQVIIGTVCVEGAACGLIALANTPVMVMAGLACISAAVPIFGAVETTYRLTLTPDDMQGRVNSLIGFLFWGTQPMGTALGGILLPALGSRVELWIVAVGLLLSIGLVSTTEVRRA